MCIRDRAETRPVYSLSEPKPSKLDPYKEQIAVWLEEAPCLLYTSDIVRLQRTLYEVGRLLKKV